MVIDISFDYFIEAKRFSFEQTPVPLSAKMSFFMSSGF